MELFTAILSGGGITLTLFVFYLASDRLIENYVAVPARAVLRDVLTVLLTIGAMSYHIDGPAMAALDLRGAAIGLTVLFGGARYGLLTAVTAILMRLASGDTVPTADMANIACNLLAAIAISRWIVPGLPQGFWPLFIMGTVTGTVTAGEMLFVAPGVTGFNLLTTLGPTIFAVQLSATLLFGWLMALQLDRQIGQQARAVVELERLALEHGLATSPVEFIVKIGADGSILDASEAYARRAGYSLQAIKSLHLWDLKPDPSPTHWLTQAAGIKAVGHMIYETDHRTASGEIWPVEVNAVYDASGDYIIAFMRDITERRRAEQELSAKNAALTRALEQTIDVLAAALNSRDPMARSHARHVRDLSMRLGRLLGLGSERLRGLWLGATVQNVGQIQTPAEILNRPRALTSEEFELVKLHPEAGFEILRDVQLPWAVADIVRQHHENVDGSGYPQGLTGEDILLEARILRVADSLVAMLSHRPFRRAHDQAYAVGELRRLSGTCYDATVVQACVGLIEQEGYPEFIPMDGGR